MGDAIILNRPRADEYFRVGEFVSWKFGETFLREIGIKHEICVCWHECDSEIVIKANYSDFKIQHYKFDQIKNLMYNLTLIFYKFNWYNSNK